MNSQFIKVDGPSNHRLNTGYRAGWVCARLLILKMKISDINPHIAALGGLIFHESFHYLAARALGLRAGLHINYVQTDYHRVDWRAYVVTLAPAAATLLLSGWLIWRFATHHLGWLVAITVINAVGWLLMCWQDFYDALYMWRHGKLCSELAPPIPIIHQRWWDMRKSRHASKMKQA